MDGLTIGYIRDNPIKVGDSKDSDVVKSMLGDCGCMTDITDTHIKNMGDVFVQVYNGAVWCMLSRIIITLALSLIAVQADGISVEVFGVSKHNDKPMYWEMPNDKKDYNDKHNLYGISYNRVDGYSVGYREFINSYYIDSFMIYVCKHYEYKHHLGLDIEFGYVTGYTENQMPIRGNMYILPNITYTVDMLRVNLLTDLHSVTIITFELGKFK